MSIDLLRCALPSGSAPSMDVRRADHPFVLAAATQALAAARQTPHRAGAVLTQWFRRNRKLGSRDRRLVSEMVYDTLRHEGILTRAGAENDEQRVAQWLAVQRGERFSHVSSLGPEDDYATALSLPVHITSQWLALHGPQHAAELGSALSRRAPTTIRANRLRCSRAQLADRLRAEGLDVSETPQASNGLHVHSRANFQTLHSFREGWFEVQDEASQIFCEALSVAPGQRVLDLCAGAGGKSLALAAAGAHVTAHDIRSNALQELQRRAKRAGARIRIAKPQSADIVIIDAPCSGTGRLRRDPALRLGLAQRDITPLLHTQRALLDQGASLVRPGGALVYATCSLLPAEHQHDLPGWQLCDDRVLWPHQGNTDGFSWRIWRRSH